MKDVRMVLAVVVAVLWGVFLTCTAYHAILGKA